MAANISHRDFSYRQFIHLICSRVIPKMMALIDTKRKQVNCRRNKLSISLFFYIWHLSRPAFHSLCPWGVNPLQKYKYFFKTNNLLPAFCVVFFRLPSLCRRWQRILGQSYPKRSFIFTSLFTHPLCVFRFTPCVVIKVCSKAFFVLVATANDDILSRSRCS